MASLTMDKSLSELEVVGDGHGSLTCCRPWGCKELDMNERLNNNMQRPQALFCLLLWPWCTACGILLPQPGTEPTSSAVKAWSPNH